MVHPPDNQPDPAGLLELFDPAVGAVIKVQNALQVRRPADLEICDTAAWKGCGTSAAYVPQQAFKPAPVDRRETTPLKITERERSGNKSVTNRCLVTNMIFRDPGGRGVRTYWQRLEGDAAQLATALSRNTPPANAGGVFLCISSAPRNT